MAELYRRAKEEITDMTPEQALSEMARREEVAVATLAQSQRAANERALMLAITLSASLSRYLIRHSNEAGHNRATWEAEAAARIGKSARTVRLYLQVRKALYQGFDACTQLRAATGLPNVIIPESILDHPFKDIPKAVATILAGAEPPAPSPPPKQNPAQERLDRIQQAIAVGGHSPTPEQQIAEELARFAVRIWRQDQSIQGWKDRAAAVLRDLPYGDPAGHLSLRGARPNRGLLYLATAVPLLEEHIEAAQELLGTLRQAEGRQTVTDKE